MSLQLELAASARSQKICAHLDLIKPIAAGLNRRFARLGMSQQDLEQIGAIGLIQAADRDDGRNFAALARRAIRGAIVDAIRGVYAARLCELPEAAGAAISERPVSEALEIKLALQQLPPMEEQVLLRRLEGYTVAEIAGHIRMEPRQVRTIEERAVDRLKLARGRRTLRKAA